LQFYADCIIIIMHEEQIKLWTIHSPDFSLTDGRVDHNKSKYYLDTPGVKDAYPKLWHKVQIPDGQVVWCCTYENDIVKTETEMIKWDLSIPSSKVIRFIDQLVWDLILGYKCTPRNMHDQWFEEWKKIPNNPNTLKAYLKKREEEFWEQKRKSGDLWDQLFVKNTGEYISALIRHPIPSEWIYGRITWCCKEEN